MHVVQSFNLSIILLSKFIFIALTTCLTIDHKYDL